MRSATLRWRATGIYWKPVWAVLAEAFELVLANAMHVKNVPGRKTDVNDAMWLADLLAHGLIRSSFVPPMAVQARRDLTRARKQLMRKRSRTFSGSTKTLQAANLKLGSVLSDIMGASGRAILDVLAQSQTDPECLADQVHTRIRASRAQLVEALRGRISDPPAPAAAHPPRPGRCHHDPRRQRCRGRCHRLRDRRRHGFRVGGPRVRISLPPAASLQTLGSLSRRSPQVCNIEDKASGTQLIQELITDGFHRVVRYKPECDKVMRLHAQTALIENGFVYIPEIAPWLAEYLHEMMVFPKGKHDDQVDSTAQFLDWFKTPMAGWGIYDFYRQKAEALAAVERGEEPKPVESQIPDLMEVYREAREHFDRGRYAT
jgi:Transposase/Terminase RNaseH-like domain